MSTASTQRSAGTALRVLGSFALGIGLTLGTQKALTLRGQPHLSPVPAPAVSEERKEPAPSPGEARSDPLLTLNKAFRVAYAQARAQARDGARPVILVSGDDLILLRDSGRSEVEVIPPLYHTLKTVAHVPLALYVMLVNDQERPLDEDRLDGLRRYRGLILKAREHLKDRLPAVLLDRQETVLSESLAFLDRVLEQKRVEKDDLAAFTRSTGPLLLANADAAARAQIDTMSSQVTAWQSAMTPAERRNLRVVVMGSHTPRVGNLAMQYFARVLGEPADDRRLIYAEAVSDEKRALDLLGTCVLDTGVGAAFFGDPRRMHRDLLADAAEEYLKQLRIEP
jgi:hypothetical protein